MTGSISTYLPEAVLRLLQLSEELFGILESRSILGCNAELRLPFHWLFCLEIEYPPPSQAQSPSRQVRLCQSTSNPCTNLPDQRLYTSSASVHLVKCNSSNRLATMLSRSWFWLDALNVGEAVIPYLRSFFIFSISEGNFAANVSFNDCDPLLAINFVIIKHLSNTLAFAVL